jgi:uracil-DNA glycosylase family 4
VSPHEKLAREIVRCTRCPRLVSHCREVARTKRAAFQNEQYWGKPIPNFGDPGARVLVVGLAPAAHGGNRTGRLFTGDRSGDWLFRALHETGFANQAESVRRGDGLKLRGLLITAVAHCAPPANKLTAEERANCSRFLRATLDLLPKLRVIVALGKVAYDACAAELRGPGREFPKFAHGAESSGPPPVLLGSYHPSQQNTFTGKLTREMLREVFVRARAVGYPEQR